MFITFEGIEGSGKSVQIARAEAYLVRCYRCLEEFNALESAWCSCLAVTPSLVCPHCLQCFCQAPHAYKTAFWAKAPQELFRKRQDLKHRVLHLQIEPAENDRGEDRQEEKVIPRWDRTTGESCFARNATS